MFPIRPLSSPPNHHFFGYYGISAWNSSGRYHLALQTDFHDRRPDPEDSAVVGLIDTQTGAFEPRADTRAFNLQQGSMMHWLSIGETEEFTFNDWEDGELVSRAVNLETGDARTIHGAIAAISPTAPVGIGLNFKRMALCRSVVGYASGNQGAPVPCPDDDGLFLLDLQTGNSRLLLSLADLFRDHPLPDSVTGAAWFNHVMFNPDGSRILFFCRAQTEEKYVSSLWTMNADGSDLECKIDFGTIISHFAWFDSDQILISSDAFGELGFYALSDGTNDTHPVGRGVLPADGHACFSPDGVWLVCDTYPQGADSRSELMLYHLDENRKTSLGRFDSPKPFRGDIRCDLHPRWRPDGRAISFDSIHEGTRQIYEVDLNSL